MAPPVTLCYFRLLNYKSFNIRLYFSLNLIWVIKSERMRWTGQVARMGEGRDAYRFFVGRPEGKRPLGSSRRRKEDNIKMGLLEVGYWCMDWIELAHDRDRWRALVNAVLNLWVTQSVGNFLTS